MSLSSSSAPPPAFMMHEDDLAVTTASSSATTQHLPRHRRAQIAVRLRPPRIPGDEVAITAADATSLPPGATVIVSDETGVLSQRGGSTRLEFPVDVVFGGDVQSSSGSLTLSSSASGSLSASGAAAAASRSSHGIMMSLYGSVLEQGVTACETVAVFASGSSGAGKTHCMFGRRGYRELLSLKEQQQHAQPKKQPPLGDEHDNVALESATESDAATAPSDSDNDAGRSQKQKLSTSTAVAAQKKSAMLRNEDFQLHGRGLVQETVTALFARGAQKLRVSCAEIYCGQVHDLLDRCRVKRVRERAESSASSFSASPSSLSHPFHDNIDNRVYVEDIAHIDISSTRDWQTVMEPVIDKRRTAATDKNQRSSRSHAIVWISVLVSATESTTAEALSSTSPSTTAAAPKQRWITGKGLEFCFVDLAGSERPSKASSFGPPLSKESIAINKSLTALGTALQSLVELNTAAAADAASSTAQGKSGTVHRNYEAMPLSSGSATKKGKQARQAKTTASGATMGRSASVGGINGSSSNNSSASGFPSSSPSQNLFPASNSHQHHHAAVVASLRESTLTWLLQRFLQGSSYTSFIGCVDSSRSQLAESVQTLRYVGRLRGLHTLYHAPSPSSVPGGASTGKRRNNNNNNSSSSRRAQHNANDRDDGDGDGDGDDDMRGAADGGADNNSAKDEAVVSSLRAELAQYRSVATGIQEIQRNRIDELIARIAQMEDEQKKRVKQEQEQHQQLQTAQERSHSHSSHRKREHAVDEDEIEAPYARSLASLPPQQRFASRTTTQRTATTTIFNDFIDSKNNKSRFHDPSAALKRDDNIVVSSSNSSGSSSTTSLGDEEATAKFNLARVANFDFSPTRIIAAVRNNNNKFTTTTTRATSSSRLTGNNDQKRRRALLSSPPEFDEDEVDHSGANHLDRRSVSTSVGDTSSGNNNNQAGVISSPQPRLLSSSRQRRGVCGSNDIGRNREEDEEAVMFESRHSFPSRFVAGAGPMPTRRTAMSGRRRDSSSSLDADETSRRRRGIKRRQVTDRDPTEYKVGLWIQARMREDFFSTTPSRPQLLAQNGMSNNISTSSSSSAAGSAFFYPALKALSQLRVETDTFFDALMPSHAVVAYIVGPARTRKSHRNQLNHRAASEPFAAADDLQRETCAVELAKSLPASGGVGGGGGCLAALSHLVHGFTSKFGLSLSLSSSSAVPASASLKCDGDDVSNSDAFIGGHRASSPQSSLALGSIVDVAASVMLSALPPLIEMHPLGGGSVDGNSSLCSLFDPSSSEYYEQHEQQRVQTSSSSSLYDSSAAKLSYRRSGGIEQTHVFAIVDAAESKLSTTAAGSAAAAAAWPCSCCPVISHDSLVPFAAVIAVRKSASPFFALQLRSEVDKFASVLQWARAEVAGIERRSEAVAAATQQEQEQEQQPRRQLEEEENARIRADKLRAAAAQSRVEMEQQQTAAFRADDVDDKEHDDNEEATVRDQRTRTQQQQQQQQQHQERFEEQQLQKREDRQRAAMIRSMERSEADKHRAVAVVADKKRTAEAATKRRSASSSKSEQREDVTAAAATADADVSSVVASSAPLPRKRLTRAEIEFAKTEQLQQHAKDLQEKRKRQQQPQQPQQTAQDASVSSAGIAQHVPLDTSSAAHAPLKAKRNRNYNIDKRKLGLEAPPSSSSSSSSSSSFSGDALDCDDAGDVEPSPLPRRAGSRGGSREGECDKGKKKRSTPSSSSLAIEESQQARRHHKQRQSVGELQLPEGAVFISLANRSKAQRRRHQDGPQVGMIVLTRAEEEAEKAMISGAALARSQSAAASSSSHGNNGVVRSNSSSSPNAQRLLLKPLPQQSQRQQASFGDQQKRPLLRASSSATTTNAAGKELRSTSTARSDDLLTLSEYDFDADDDDDEPTGGTLTEFESIKHSLKVLARSGEQPRRNPVPPSGVAATTAAASAAASASPVPVALRKSADRQSSAGPQKAPSSRIAVFHAQRPAPAATAASSPHLAAAATVAGVAGAAAAAPQVRNFHVRRGPQQQQQQQQRRPMLAERLSEGSSDSAATPIEFSHEKQRRGEECLIA